MVTIMYKVKKSELEVNIPLKQLAVDQTPALRFGVNKYGFLRSDRDLLLAAAANNDEKQVRDIMEMAAQSGVTNPPNTGLSDEQLLDTLVPHWVNSPGDFKHFARELASKSPYSVEPQPADSPVSAKEEKPVDQPAEKSE